MRRKNLLKELGIQKQADTSCNALDIDTENIRQRVYAKLDFADTERKQMTMRSKKKILPLLIAATLTIGATAVAATGKISMWTGSSASRADYTSLPTAEQVTKDIGYRPVLIDTFENGYCFKDGNIVKNSFKDDNANVIEKFKSVSFDYQKNGDVVSFEQQKFNSKLTPAGDIIATINGTNLYYVHYINKVVSDDYELTEQDKKDQASGKVVFSYDDSASQIEVSQVQSVNWNKELANEIGVSMGQEYVDADNYGWYGPAMNIHRTAFAGRNFEYYSEDSLLSGYMAANEMNGAATKGVYPYMKHFALNDQETNRCSFLLTFASEQTIREGYLKAFELATKGFEGKAMAVMSSFNWIGTVPSCANNELLNNVLRGEWGFVGMVETDYDGSYGYMITDHCIRNGNDLMLGFNSAESNKLTDESATAVLAMRQACKNILYTVANSGYYADGNPATGMTNMTKLFVMIDVILAVVLIVVDTIVIVRWRKKKKQAVNE